MANDFEEFEAELSDECALEEHKKCAAIDRTQCGCECHPEPVYCSQCQNAPCICDELLEKSIDEGLT